MNCISENSNVGLKYFRDNYLLVLIIIAEALLSFTPLSGLNWIISIVAISLLLPFAWSFLRKLFVSYLLLYAVYGSSALLFFVLKQPFSISLIAIFITSVAWKYRKKYKRITPLVDRRDILPIASALAAIALMVPMIIRYDNGWHLPLLSMGDDVISHLNIAYEIFKQRGLIYGPNGEYPIYPAGLRNYPQLAHLNLAALGWAFLGTWQIGSVGFINFFCIYLIFIFAVASYLLASAAVELMPAKLPYYLAAAPIVLLLGPGFVLLLLMKYTFFSQVSSIILLLGVMLLCQSLQKTNNLRTICLLAVFVESAVGGTWLFMSPISGALLWLILFLQKKNLGVGFLLKLLLLSIVLNLCQLYFPVTGLDLKPQTVNLTGGVELLPEWIFKLVYAGAFLALLGKYENSAKQARLTVILVALLAISFSVCVNVYQSATTGGLSYFYFKSLYSVAIVLTILAAAAPALVIERLKSFHKLLDSKIIFSLAIVASLLLIFPIYSRTKSTLDIFIHDSLYFLPKKTYNEIINLLDSPLAEDTVIHVYHKKMYDAYFMGRWILVLTQGTRSPNKDIGPFIYGTGYRRELEKKLRENSSSSVPVVLDPYNFLGRSCSYEYFNLARKNKIIIWPKGNKLDKKVCQKNKKAKALRKKRKEQASVSINTIHQ
ncbi:MAG: hypothetical protein IT292_08180 [Deltaproteobacteria bacterium]|nr:hypothetical protein [Deltaproteobacteria bacterium]